MPLSMENPRRRASGASFTYDHLSNQQNDRRDSGIDELAMENNNYILPADSAKRMRGTRRASIDRSQHAEEPDNQMALVRQSMKRGASMRSVNLAAHQEEVSTPPPRTLTKTFEQRFRGMLESSLFQIFATLFTFWALFSDNVRLAATRKDADIVFEVIISLIFFFFMFEIFLKLLYEERYFNIPKFKSNNPDETLFEKWYRRKIGSFYFWMDFISTISLIIEMKWVVGNSLQDTVSNNGRAVAITTTGTRAARIVRLARIARLVRFIKLVSNAIREVNWRKYFCCQRTVEKEAAKLELDPESKVGAAMAELTNRRATLFVLIMFIIIPLLSFTKVDYKNSTASLFIHRLAILNSTDPETYQDALMLSISNCIEHTDVIGILLNGVWMFRDERAMNSLRDEEKFRFDLTDGHINTQTIFDQSEFTQQTAAFAIYLTIFVMALLGLSIFFFSREVDRLVIVPIEKMVALVKKISANPLGVDYKSLDEVDGFVKGMETTILLTTITKIGGLMRIGFGEAGANIIAKNLADSASGKLNLTGAGVQIHSIFGFCDVRQFTDTTECLQEEVMLFVNRIAHILHSIVVQCKGAANKNIGDAFLLTWKLDEKLPSSEAYILADQALLAFCRSLIALSRYQNFICDFSASATSRLMSKFPNYKVRIGCGLHVGWAIEGAIGSNRKIDASYLSPHVSFTEYLESSTKKYGVSLLMSEPFWKTLSPQAKECCRQVDRVKPTNEDKPVGLFTYDVNLDLNWEEIDRLNKLRKIGQLPAGLQRRNSIKPKRLSVSVIAQQKTIDIASSPPEVEKGSKAYELTKLKHVSIERSGVPANEQDVENANYSPAMENPLQKIKEAPTFRLEPYTTEIWSLDPDLLLLRKVLDSTNRKIYDKAFMYFLAGEWSKAIDLFKQVRESKTKSDGPSQHLIEYMTGEKFNGVAPPNWEGYRNDEDD